MVATPGPAIVQPAQAAGSSTPDGGVAFSGAVVSAGPSGPASADQAQQQQQPAFNQYQPYPDQPAFDPSMFGMPPMPKQNTDDPNGTQYTPVNQPNKPLIHPARLAAIGGSAVSASPAGFMGSPAPQGYTGSPQPDQLAGQVRPFEEEQDQLEGSAAKRPKVDKLANGAFYPVSLFTIICGYITKLIICTREFQTI